MSEANDIKTRMGELIHFITDANEKIKGGDMVDLMGLDDEVASLCDRALALPPQEAMTIQPLMADMISNLEELGRTLEDYQNKLKNQDGA